MFPPLPEPWPRPVYGHEPLRLLQVYANGKQRISRSSRLVLMGSAGCGIRFSRPFLTEGEVEVTARVAAVS